MHVHGVLGQWVHIAGTIHSPEQIPKFPNGAPLLSFDIVDTEVFCREFAPVFLQLNEVLHFFALYFWEIVLPDLPKCFSMNWGWTILLQQFLVTFRRIAFVL